MASKPAQKRLSKEFLEMQRSPPPFVWAAPDERNILHWNFIVEDGEDEDVGMEDGTESKDKGEGGEQPQEVDNDSSWIGHKLKFAKDDGSETRRAEHDYEVIDPRARGNQAKMEERERKANKRSNVGQAFQKGRR
ncbi:unnamed protein product [Rhizoctonia solani]|uniref:Uncharacterized protein n=1 Tax=Rhizoctonia solani TaxID=456999 RepID=A0A8H3CE38_9AGAM|nr:unnamed protein product [Rhizoctonia solani]